MAPKIKARKIENGYVLSCNGKEFSSTSKEGAVAIAQELYCKEVAPIKAVELINSLNKPETNLE
jgi:hypothetical protein